VDSPASSSSVVSLTESCS